MGQVILGGPWLFVFGLAPAIVIAVLCAVARRWPAKPGDAPEGPWCSRCGYSLHGHDLDACRCPECGIDCSPKTVIPTIEAFRKARRRRLNRWSLTVVLAYWAVWAFLMPGFYYTGVDYHSLLIDDRYDEMYEA